MEIEIRMSAEKLATERENPHYIGNGVLEIIDTVPAAPPPPPSPPPSLPPPPPSLQTNAAIAVGRNH